MTTTSQTLIDFNDQSAGTIIDGQYSSQGVTIGSINNDGSVDTKNPAMIFDSSKPSGGDWDLKLPSTRSRCSTLKKVPGSGSMTKMASF